jgi:hypothetical protein
LLGAADADVAAADAASALADAAGEAAGAAGAVVVAVAAAAAGDVAAGRRRDFLNCRHSAGFSPTGRDCAYDTAALTFVITCVSATTSEMGSLLRVEIHRYSLGQQRAPALIRDQIVLP